MQDINQNPAFLYTIGGVVKKGSPIYVKRNADELLYQNLLAGNFCYVLAARQMGKSSLRINVSDRLSKVGFQCVGIDLSSFGQQVYDSNQWYYSISYAIVRKCKMNANILDYTRKKMNLTPLARFLVFLKECFLPNISGKVVLFFDEIDFVFSTQNYMLSSDDFFAAIRSLYNERSEYPELERLNIVLLGVTTPNDLIKDPLRTPFNIGASIPVGNFKFEEAKEPLLIGFKDIIADHFLLLAEIFYWTNGHPAMTQKLCRSIAMHEHVIDDIPSTVEKHVNHVFLKHQEDKSEDDTIIHISKRLMNGPFCVNLLWLFYRILCGEKIAIDNTQMDQLHIKLSGLVINENGYLAVSNRVFLLAFSRQWVIKQLEKHDRTLASDIDYWIMSGKKELKPSTATELIKTLTSLEYCVHLDEIEGEYYRAVNSSITGFSLKARLRYYRSVEWLREMITSLPSLLNRETHFKG